MSPLETILLASPSKPIVQPPTHRLLTEVLADLTFMYGTEKGCEGLADLWKKIKLPQEPERVSRGTGLGSSSLRLSSAR